MDNLAGQVRTILTGDYRHARPVVAALHEAFHRELAAALQPKLNEHLKTLPQDTLDEKRELATWVNAELRQLGLVIRCPRTDLPAVLVGDFKNAANRNSTRFRIQVRDVGRTYRTLVTATLPELDLMADPPRREYLARRGPPDSESRGR